MNPFLKFLSDLRHGDLIEELAEQLEKLSEEISEHGTGGSITLTIKIKPWKKDPYAREITDAVKVNSPKPETGPSLLYAKTDGGFSARDPRQPDLPFRPKSVGEAIVTDAVDPETGELSASTIR